MPLKRPELRITHFDALDHGELNNIYQFGFYNAESRTGKSSLLTNFTVTADVEEPRFAKRKKGLTSNTPPNRTDPVPSSTTLTEEQVVESNVLSNYDLAGSLPPIVTTELTDLRHATITASEAALRYAREAAESEKIFHKQKLVRKSNQVDGMVALFARILQEAREG